MSDNATFLFAAFAVAWLLIFGYLLFLGGRIGSLRGEVEALRDELDARAPVGDPAGETTAVIAEETRPAADAAPGGGQPAVLAKARARRE